MRIGISSFWFNRGQAVVARQLRSALDSLGHETFVLARPTRAGNIRPSFIDRSDVWDQPEITEASAYEIPAAELEQWAADNALEAAFFDQNYQFEEIGRLRALGVRTVGRFVWEQFAAEDAEPARAAFDVIYSLTGAERERYADMGIESPRVHWGIHPELLVSERQQDSGAVTYFFPGGFMSRRKPIEATLDAFQAARGDQLRLVVKSQVDRGSKSIRKAAKRDRRIALIADDLPAAEHLKLFSSADVCLAPSRWEGLGLHLYEATALGLPIITNDNPPMNEVVSHEVNGLLVAGVPSSESSGSGIPAFEPNVPELTAAIERLADLGLRARLAEGAARRREALPWSRTVDDVSELLG
jgi:1,2-diacylglycerol 3-alpha-glucosyltransferase